MAPKEQKAHDLASKEMKRLMKEAVEIKERPNELERPAATSSSELPHLSYRLMKLSTNTG